MFEKIDVLIVHNSGRYLVTFPTGGRLASLQPGQLPFCGYLFGPGKMRTLDTAQSIKLLKGGLREIGMRVKCADGSVPNPDARIIDTDRVAFPKEEIQPGKGWLWLLEHILHELGSQS